MRLRRRADRDRPDAELDRRLYDIFDDRRTPGAPDHLYEYVREIPMTRTAANGSRVSRTWRTLGRTGRVAASLAAVLTVVAGTVVIAGLGRAGNDGTGGAGSATGSANPASMPSMPPAPGGWHFVSTFGQGDDAGGTMTGVQVLIPGQLGDRLAVHVVCTGIDSLVVMLGTGSTGDVTGQILQSAVFRCDQMASASEARVVFTAKDQPFSMVWAVIVRSPSSLITDAWVVSLEAPDASPAPSPSA